MLAVETELSYRYIIRAIYGHYRGIFVKLHFSAENSVAHVYRRRRVRDIVYACPPTPPPVYSWRNGISFKCQWVVMMKYHF